MTERLRSRDSNDSAEARPEKSFFDRLVQLPGGGALRDLKVQKLAEGAYLYHAGDPAKSLFSVRKGELRTLRESAAGRVTTLEVLRAGELLGMGSLALQAEYAESAQALVQSEVWLLPRRVFDLRMQSDSALGAELLRLVAGRLQRAQDRLCAFAHDSVASRIARTLLDASTDARIETTRRVLGETAGTTVETAIRVLRRFEREGWIAGGVGWVEILDRAALERVARSEDL